MTLMGCIKRACHFGNVAYASVSNVFCKLINDTAALFKNLLQEAIYFADGFGVGIIFDDFQLSLAAVRLERWRQSFGHHLFDIDVGAGSRLQIDGVSMVYEVVCGAVGVNFQQQPVHAVIVEVILPGDVPEHEETVVDVVAVRDERLLVPLVEVELLAQGLGVVPVHSGEEFLEHARLVLVQTLVPAHHAFHHRAVDVVLFVLLEQLQHLCVSVETCGSKLADDLEVTLRRLVVDMPVDHPPSVGQHEVVELLEFLIRHK